MTTVTAPDTFAGSGVMEEITMLGGVASTVKLTLVTALVLAVLEPSLACICRV